jgi:probable HAF family extracellular repeat protein
MLATTTGLINLGALSNADDASFAFDINDRGQVTGWSVNSVGDMHAFVWTAATGMRDIGTLAGTTVADNRSMRADKSPARARSALARQSWRFALLKAPE